MANKKTILITGGGGFIGHHFVEGLLKKTDWDIVILDALTYAGNLNRLTDIDIWDKEKHRVKFVWHFDNYISIFILIRRQISHKC